MLIYVKKIETMVITKEPIECKLAVHQQLITQKINCDYLAGKISSSRNKNQEVRNQAIKAARIFGYVRDLVWKSPKDSKVRINIYREA